MNFLRDSAGIGLQGRLLKAFSSSALVLSALASTVVLASSAQAVETCESGSFPATNFTNCQDTSSDPNTPFSVDWISGPTGGIGDIELTDISASQTYPTAQLDVGFAPPVNTASLGQYRYKITGPAQFDFSFFKISTQSTTPWNATKYIFGDDSFTNLSLLATLELASDDVNEDVATYLSPTNQIWVEVNYFGDSIENLQDIHSTPGPLPVLGAGAAFGFSRKLRNRIKASRQS